MAIRLDAHRDEMHRDQQWHKPVRVATTGSITIASGLNAGDIIDGVTLAAGDRVLVKDQGSADNGIYIAGASPARAYDFLTGIQAWGSITYVIAGTANGGKAYKNTNTTLPTIGSTTLTFSEFGGGAPSGAAGGDLSGTYPNPSVVDDSHSHTGATISGITAVPTGILLESDHSNPFTFDNILQESDGTDFLWESE